MTFSPDLAARLIREWEECTVPAPHSFADAFGNQLRGALERLDFLDTELADVESQRDTAIAERDAARAELARVMPRWEQAAVAISGNDDGRIRRVFLTGREIEALRTFYQECVDGNNAMGDAPIPSPLALAAIAKLIHPEPKP